jgi:hypothetical protein
MSSGSSCLLTTKPDRVSHPNTRGRRHLANSDGQFAAAKMRSASASRSSGSAMDATVLAAAASVPNRRAACRRTRSRPACRRRSFGRSSFRRLVVSLESIRPTHIRARLFAPPRRRPAQGKRQPTLVHFTAGMCWCVHIGPTRTAHWAAILTNSEILRWSAVEIAAGSNVIDIVAC